MTKGQFGCANMQFAVDYIPHLGSELFIACTGVVLMYSLLIPRLVCDIWQFLPICHQEAPVLKSNMLAHSAPFLLPLLQLSQGNVAKNTPRALLYFLSSFYSPSSSVSVARHEIAMVLDIDDL